MCPGELNDFLSESDLETFTNLMNPYWYAFGIKLNSAEQLLDGYKLFSYERTLFVVISLYIIVW